MIDNNKNKINERVTKFLTLAGFSSNLEAKPKNKLPFNEKINYHRSYERININI